MKENLRNLGRCLALVIMTALVLRPLVVSAHNASLPESFAFSAHSSVPSLAGQATDDHSYAKAESFKLLRTLQKEKQDPSPLRPWTSRAVVFQVEKDGLSPNFVQPSSSPFQTFQVLRI
jgi:hypothetical protein